MGKFIKVNFTKRENTLNYLYKGQIVKIIVQGRYFSTVKNLKGKIFIVVNKFLEIPPICKHSRKHIPKFCFCLNKTEYNCLGYFCNSYFPE